VEINRRELLRVIALVAICWIALLLILARWQQRTPTQPASAEPQLIHYPGTEAVQEQTVPNLGFRKYWFQLNEDYPSKSVFYFYCNKLEPQGWQLIAKDQPRWRRRLVKGKAYDIFQALWLSPNRLFQLELEMVSPVKLVRRVEETVTEEREPGIRIYVTQRRVALPALMMPPAQPQPSRPEIEVE